MIPFKMLINNLDISTYLCVSTLVPTIIPHSPSADVHCHLLASESQIGVHAPGVPNGLLLSASSISNSFESKSTVILSCAQLIEKHTAVGSVTLFKTQMPFFNSQQSDGHGFAIGSE